MKVHKGDTVLVIAGKDKGAKGKVIQAYPTRNRVLVEGVNRIKKHTAQSANERGASSGGIVTQEAPFVLKLGPDCYKDEKRFPSGPWCKEGDFIITRPMAGSRIKIHGREFRMINDDAVEGVVEDPRGITRA